jgi:titin
MTAAAALGAHSPARRTVAPRNARRVMAGLVLGVAVTAGAVFVDGAAAGAAPVEDQLAADVKGADAAPPTIAQTPAPQPSSELAESSNANPAPAAEPPPTADEVPSEASDGPTLAPDPTVPATTSTTPLAGPEVPALAATSSEASAPAPPQSLTALVAPAGGLGSGQVRLSWAPPVDGGSIITGYVLEQTTSEAGPWIVVDHAVPASATSHLLDGLTGGVQFYFRLAARNDVGQSDYSGAVTATPRTVPTTSLGGSAYSTYNPYWNGGVQLYWSVNSYGLSTTGYVIERSLDGVTGWTQVSDTPTGTNRADVFGLTGGTPYYFRVAMSNMLGRGPFSNVVSLTSITTPSAPTSLTAIASPDGGLPTGSVRVTWDVPQIDGGSPITGYQLETRDTTTGQWNKVCGLYPIPPANRTCGFQGQVGVPMTFRVAAWNAKSLGEYSPVVTATPLTLPPAPSVQAEGLSSGQVRLTWNSANPPALVTAYSVEMSPDGDGDWTTVATGLAANSTSYTQSGLVAGTHYFFRVAAHNSLGRTDSNVVYAKPVTVPSVPQDVAAGVAPAAGLGEVKLTWSAPAQDGGTPVTQFTVQRSPDGSTGWTTIMTVGGSARVATIAGLTPGLKQYFRVAARNAAGEGPYSPAVNATPPMTPATPSLTAHVAPSSGVGSGEVLLTWVPASNGGTPLTGYTIEWTYMGISGVYSNVSPTATSYLVTGRTNGSTYSFRISASNAVGDSAPSTWVTAAPRTVPATPVSLAAQVFPTSGVGAGQVRLTWGTPANGGSAITGYVIERSTDGSSGWTTVSGSVPPSATSYLVTGLTGGTNYFFRVAAMNAAGQGTFTNPISRTPPAVVPSAPISLAASVNPEATLGRGEVLLSWQRPTSDGGFSLTGYQVERSITGTGGWTTIASTVAADATTYTASGLTDGTRYYFRVAARNAHSLGVYSDVVDATPVSTSSEPRQLTAAVAPIVGSGQVRLTWTAPSTLGGLSVTSYRVTQLSEGQSSWETIADAVPSTTLSYLVDGLDNGAQYYFQVIAHNVVGDSLPSAWVGAVPRTVPSTPSALSIAAAPSSGVKSGQLRVSWIAPDSDGGSAITGYVVELSTNGTYWMTAGYTQGTTTSYLATGLTNGTTYMFRVTAYNNAGTGATSSVVDAVSIGEPAPPTISELTAGDRAINVSLTPPTTNGGSPITSYTVTVRSGSSVVASETSAEGAIKVTGLTRGATYIVVANAANSIGSSVWSAEREATLPDVPASPAITELTGGDGSLRVIMSPPASGGSPIIGYTVQVRSGSVVVATATSTQPAITVSGLTRGASYTVVAAAINAIGQSEWSSQEITLSDVPAAPTITDVGGADRSFTANLAPATSGGSPITEYTVQVRSGTTVVGTRTATAPSITVDGLTPGETYTVVAAASNMIGQSPWSAAQSVTMPPPQGLSGVVPGRLLETRPGEYTVDGQFQGGGRRPAGSITEVKVTGRSGVPDDADAVMLNLTVVSPETAGWLTVFPCGSPQPLASHVNYQAGQTVANAVLAKVGAGGKVCIYTSAATNLIADVNGYIPPGSSTHSVVPGRLLETRPGEYTVDGQFQGGGRRPAGSITEVKVTGRSGVPDNADKVRLNVTAVSPDGPGHLTVYPCGSPRPSVAHVDYQAGATISNAVHTDVSPDGTVCIYTTSATDIIADINAYT